MTLSKDEEIAMLRETVALMEKEASISAELIATLREQIQTLEAYNAELVSMLKKML